MATHTLAHFSDLHIGSGDAERTAAALCHAALSARVDHVVVSGDVTHGGCQREWARFEQIFHPLLRTGRMTVVPGNHDRLGDDVREVITGGRRVWCEMTSDLYIVCIDSSGPHNRGWFASHGVVSEAEVQQAVALLDAAPPGILRVVTLHHHPLPLPEDSLPERFVTRLGSANGTSLALGPTLIEGLWGRCDLLLHGHRHRPRALTLFPSECPTPLRLFNAGSSTELGRVRVLTHGGRRPLGGPYWLAAQLEAHHGERPVRPGTSTGVLTTMRAFGVI